MIQDYNLTKDFINPPLGTDYFFIKGKSYKATYFGKEDLTGWDDYSYWEIWRIEKPDETLKNLKPKKAYNYYSNYPTPVNLGDIFRIELTKIDGTKRAEYFRADGKVYDGEKSTNLILQE